MIRRVIEITQYWVFLVLRLYLWVPGDELWELAWVEGVLIRKIVEHDTALLWTGVVVLVEAGVDEGGEFLGVVLYMGHDLYPALLNLLSRTASNSLRLFHKIIIPPISIHIPKLNLQLIQSPLQLLNLLLISILQHNQLLVRNSSLATTSHHLIIGLLLLLAPIGNT